GDRRRHAAATAARCPPSLHDALPIYGAAGLAFPDWMTRLGRQVLQSATEVVDGADDLPAGTAASWGFDPTGYHPDVALVNHYDAQSKMGMHQDKDEYDPAPVVSLSLGDRCL